MLGTFHFVIVKTTRRTCLGLTALALLLPLAGTFTRFPRDARLAGREQPVKTPEFSLPNWFNGRFAASVEPWLSRHIGWRGLGIRSANQINYSVFGQTPVSAGTPVIVGREYWLYEADYARHYRQRFGMDSDLADELVADLSRIHHFLQDRGVPFVLLISPSKVEIYPEHLPPGMHPDASGPNAYEIMLPRLKAADIPLADMHAMFLTWKSRGPALFPPGGTHWNQYGAQKALDALWETARSQPHGTHLPAHPPLLGYNPITPRGTDVDLRSLLNLWRFEPGGPAEVPFPRLAPSRVHPTRVLLVGDSFAFTLIDALGRSGLAAEVDLLYYFRRRYRYRWAEQTPTPLPQIDHVAQDAGAFQPEDMNWKPFLADYDVVVLAINEIFLRDAAWGFPSRLGEVLAKEP